MRFEYTLVALAGSVAASEYAAPAPAYGGAAPAPAAPYGGSAPAAAAPYGGPSKAPAYGGKKGSPTEDCDEDDKKGGRGHGKGPKGHGYDHKKSGPSDEDCDEDDYKGGKGHGKGPKGHGKPHGYGKNHGKGPKGHGKPDEDCDEEDSYPVSTEAPCPEETVSYTTRYEYITTVAPCEGGYECPAVTITSTIVEPCPATAVPTETAYVTIPCEECETGAPGYPGAPPAQTGAPGAPGYPSAPPTETGAPSAPGAPGYPAAPPAPAPPASSEAPYSPAPSSPVAPAPEAPAAPAAPAGSSPAEVCPGGAYCPTTVASVPYPAGTGAPACPGGGYDCVNGNSTGSNQTSSEAIPAYTSGSTRFTGSIAAGFSVILAAAFML